MNTRYFDAMGTSWWLHCDASELLGDAERRVRTLEAQLSRFRPHSALARLNRARTVVSPILAKVTRLALGFQSSTGGAFDPTLGAPLARLGYDRSFERVNCRRKRSASRCAVRDAVTRVVIDGDRVDLVGPGDLDLGGIAKGFAVDELVSFLVRHGAHSVLVDGGGDIRGFGPSYLIGAGDGLVVETHDGALATSSTASRRWSGPDGSERHHILDPRTRKPAASQIETATVIAPDAVTADVLATALIADPEAMMPRLANFGAHALVRGKDGRWWTTPDAPFVNAHTKRAKPQLAHAAAADAYR